MTYTISKRPSVPFAGKTIGYPPQSVPLAPTLMAHFESYNLLKNKRVVRMDAWYAG